MTRNQIESWALRAIDDLIVRQLKEDSFVEFKSEWPSTPEKIKKTARQIAGHANSTHGSDILWIIGVDEKAREITGANPDDLAAWWPSVTSEFESVYPDLTHVNITVEEKPVVALHFQTDRAPFVVKNESGLGNITHEVPIRDGASTRSAKRADLLKILVPKEDNPSIEVLSASLTLSKDSNWTGPDSQRFNFAADIYITPASERRLCLPEHKLGILIYLDGVSEPPVQTSRSYFTQSNAQTTILTRSEIILTAPTKITINGVLRTIPYESLDHSYRVVKVSFRPSLSDQQTTFDIRLEFHAKDHPQDGSEKTIAQWIYKPQIFNW